MIDPFLTLPAECLHQHFHKIINKDKISPRLDNEARFLMGKPMVKRWKGTAKVSWTIRIREAKRDKVKAAQLNILFPGGFAYSIAATIGLNWMHNCDRLFFRM